MDKIQLQKNDILKFEIVTDEGVSTGEFLTFDLEDIELPLKANKCDEMHRKNIEILKGKLTVLEKQQDKKGKYLLSWKEEEKIKLFKEFYNKEAEALDTFLGKGATKKLLNGRNPYYTMYDDINKSLEPIMPKLKINAESIKSKIMNKYGVDETEVLR